MINSKIKFMLQFLMIKNHKNTEDSNWQDIRWIQKIK